MHYVRLHVFLVALGVERNLIGVELIHVLEPVATHAHDDYTQGKVTTPDDLVNRLLHIVDDAVGDDQQDVILLIQLVDALALCHIVD